MSMLWLEEKYIHLLSPRLKLFHRVRHNNWNFRCPICGDSKKDAHKTRGTIYLHGKGTSYTMGCFNCGASMSFPNFLKLMDPYLFNEYVVERYAESRATHTEPKRSEVVKVENKRLSFNGVEKVTDLHPEHPAVKYLRKRQIPDDAFNRLYFVLRFKKWEAEYRYGKSKDKYEDEHPRLIIPFYDAQGNITRISARSFTDDHLPKYIYIKVKEDASRVYGLDEVSANKLVYVLEGPLDSLFLPNAIAVGSADLVVPELDAFPNLILVPDNQPRNPEVCKSIKKMIDSGLPVCLWDSDWGKDINKMVENGKSIQQIQQLISKSSVSGIAAQMKFSNWIKCRINSK